MCTHLRIAPRDAMRERCPFVCHRNKSHLLHFVKNASTQHSLPEIASVVFLVVEVALVVLWQTMSSAKYEPAFALSDDRRFSPALRMKQRFLFFCGLDCTQCGPALEQFRARLVFPVVGRSGSERDSKFGGGGVGVGARRSVGCVLCGTDSSASAICGEVQML